MYIFTQFVDDAKFAVEELETSVVFFVKVKSSANRKPQTAMQTW